MSKNRQWILDILFIMIMIFLVLVVLRISENRWEKLNNPTDKFHNINEYLEKGYTPSCVTKVKRGTNIFIIIYGTLTNKWLAIPSGPAAYVFDSSGKMIDWSYDVGDDSQYKLNWMPLSPELLSLEDLREEREK
ncbi:MAG: hypothetical protein EOM12_15110 [Verrucomicrobiae bacterium]|nr:hypothetical protein [Verrucomicrobiae bacterium]